MSSARGDLIVQADSRGDHADTRGRRPSAFRPQEVGTIVLGDVSLARPQTAGTDQHVLPGAEIVLQVCEAAPLRRTPILGDG